MNHRAMLTGLGFLALAACSPSSATSTPSPGPAGAAPDAAVAAPGDLDAGGPTAKTARVPLYPVSLATPASASSIADEILVEVTIDDVEHVLLRVDTAAPDTSMPAADAKALALSAGTHDVWIGTKAIGVHVGSKKLAILESIGSGPVEAPRLPPGSVLRGTAGNDLWAGYAVGLDFRGGELWLTAHDAALDAATLARPTGTAAPIAISADFPTHAPSPTGVLFVAASFDAAGATGQFLIDTGTNTNLVFAEYWKNVHPVSSRSIPQDSADFQGTPLHGAYRLGSGFTMGGKALAQEQPAWVLDSFPVLEGEGAYFQHPIDGLIGLWGLLPYFTTLDFGLPGGGAQPRIFLSPYEPAPETVAKKNFTGFGFALVSAAPSGGTLVRVATGSDAETKGVKDGDVLLQVAGGAYELLSTGIVAGAIGTTRTFTFQRGGASFDATIVAEALLGP